MQATHGFTHWSWTRDERELPLYGILQEPGQSDVTWTVREGSEVQMEVEPAGMEPIRLRFPLAGTLTGTEGDLDSSQGVLRLSLEPLNDLPLLAPGWASLRAEDASWGEVRVALGAVRLGRPPEEAEQRKSGDVDVRVSCGGFEQAVRLPVEVERLDGDGLLISSVGVVHLPLDRFGPLSARLTAGTGRSLSPTVGVEFQIELER